MDMDGKFHIHGKPANQIKMRMKESGKSQIATKHAKIPSNSGKGARPNHHTVTRGTSKSKRWFWFSSSKSCVYITFLQHNLISNYNKTAQASFVQSCEY